MIHRKFWLTCSSLYIASMLCLASPRADDGPTPANVIPNPEAYDTDEINDPLEPLNRVLYAINGIVDTVIFRPFAYIYRETLPDPVQRGISNVIDNLFAPVTFANHVLQGEPERAGITLVRFITNTTMGLGGLLDAGEDLGFPKHETNFAETLMVWGVDSGPYLYIPIIGGTTFRGVVGLTGDYYMNPVNWYFNNKPHRNHRFWLYVRDGLDALDRRAKVIDLIDDLARTSPDLYVTLRSIHFQRLKYRRQVLARKINGEDTEVLVPGKLEDTPRPTVQAKQDHKKIATKEKNISPEDQKKSAEQPASSAAFDTMVKMDVRGALPNAPKTESTNDKPVKKPGTMKDVTSE